MEKNKNFVSFLVNNDKPEEQTAKAEIGTASTQLTTTFNSLQSRGNLNPSVNLTHMESISNSIFEMATDREEFPKKFESTMDDRTILSKEPSWNSRRDFFPHCDDESHHIQTNHKNYNKMAMVKKKMIGEYKLSESVAELVRKYEQKSRMTNN
uniref:Uncharacterized protein n=1 Tax=Elaeophora elaphi TaxID=1147741 RepID=A0A0R3RU79_9BILA